MTEVVVKLRWEGDFLYAGRVRVAYAPTYPGASGYQIFGEDVWTMDEPCAEARRAAAEVAAIKALKGE